MEDDHSVVVERGYGDPGRIQYLAEREWSPVHVNEIHQVARLSIVDLQEVAVPLRRVWLAEAARLVPILVEPEECHIDALVSVARGPGACALEEDVVDTGLRRKRALRNSR